MTENPFDKGARYAAKRDPPRFFQWLIPGLDGVLAFQDWVDTRTLPFPGEPDRTCDTVGGFVPVSGDGSSWAIIVEFAARSEAGMLDRLLDYLVRLWRQPHPTAEGQERRQVAAAVVNLTGPAQPDSLDMALPGGVQAKLHFQIVQRTLRDEDAPATLQGIAAGAVTPWILPLMPLMRGGADPAIIAIWKQLASADPDSRNRADYGGLVLVFAELAGCWEVWKRALEGWNVLVSQQVLEWQAMARTETQRADLLRVLQARFQTPVPEDLATAVEALADPEELSRWLVAASTASSFDAFRSAVRNGQEPPSASSPDQDG